MKFIYRIVLLIVVVTLNQSCSDLNEDTTSLLSLDKLATEGDVNASLAPMYSELLNLHTAPHTLRTATYGGDDITTWIAGNKAPLRVFDGFDYGSGENSGIIWLPLAWDSYWKVIYYCNSLVKGLKTSTAPETVIKNADAEARLFRALCYLNLVRTYGNIPNIYEEDIPNGKEERVTVLSNYQKIEEDLLIAKAALPSPAAVLPGRCSSSFAKVVLADLYMTWGGWPVKDNSKFALAAQVAKEVIDLNYHTLLPIDQLWLLSGQNSKEAIFSLRYPADKSILGGYPAAFSFHESLGFSDCFPELQFYNDFPAGARKDATFLLNIPQRQVVNGVIAAKNPSTVIWTSSQRKHPMYKKFTISEDLTLFGTKTVGLRSIELYRYAEVLLIYAEAQARVGQNSSSLGAFNQVKRRAAGLPYLTPNNTVDVTSATPNSIVDERGWELAGEYKRWFDLVRTERVEEIAAKRLVAEPVVLKRQPNKMNYIAPIPAATISLSKLVQNPQGFKIQ